MAKDSYNHIEIEKEMQNAWEKEDLHTADLTDTTREPYYLLTEFPYPSGNLHIGHWYAYALPDIYARYLRMNGKNVLFPFGFDAFGLPAENAAIKNGVDPKEWTYANMEYMRSQIRSMGASYDWSKEVITCDPEYYKWTQWLFAKLFEHGLAERKLAAVKWCPKDQTVLANEQVVNGHCERCGTEVEEKKLTQWFLKITTYAKRLLDDLEPLPWREEIKEAQRAWIGESEGARLFFDLRALTNDDAGVIEVFTTRPDTIFGATYVVLAPEHPLVETLLPLTTNRAAVESYRMTTTRKTERERSENKEKTGIPLEGICAVNPANQQEIPIYIADYVLASYGTGAVMAVPGHDERDFEFAQKYNLPIVQVVIPQLTDGSNPPRREKEDTIRHIIIGIVRDPKTQKYLCLEWKTQPWTTFITGGIEEGEDAVEAAVREIKEETGYADVKLVRILGGISESKFFAAHKDVNRTVYSTAILFELASDSRIEVASEELDQYDLEWLSEDEVVRAKLQHAEFDILWQRVQSGMDAYVHAGVLTNSGLWTGQQSEEAKWPIVEAVGGERVTNYRLRDWLVSRQRYWGCPIPVVYDPEGNAHLVPPEHLPWTLPTDVDFTPTGKSPLATSKELHERVENIFGKGWTPEYDTLDVFVDSSWYYARYLDSKDSNDFSDQELMKRWLPVHRYAGGAEHTTVHLLYARFFYKALHDLALVPSAEPFVERFNRGIILGPDNQKMSKSKGNVISPDEIVATYGSDAVRMYLAFIGPYNEPGNYPWNLDGTEGMRKFLDRVSRLADRLHDVEPSPQLERALALAITKVGLDIERFKFNTAISALMVLLRELEKDAMVSRAAFGEFLKLLAPFAPHLADHLWRKGEVHTSIHQTAWPTSSGEVIQEDTVHITVQINGKPRASVGVPSEATEEEVIAAARAVPAVHAHLENHALERVVYVPGRILNFVLKSEI